MNRLQKKCFIGSALVHLLLLVVLLIGAAFVPAPTKPEMEQNFMQLVDLPDIIVDQNVMGGNGVPVRQNAAPSQPAPAPTPTPAPPPEIKRPAPVETPSKPVEKHSEPVAEKESVPEDDQEPENAQETENKFTEKPKKKEPRKIQVNISQKIKKDPVKKSSNEDDKKAREAKERHQREVAEAEEREAREARAQAEADRRARAVDAVARVGSKFSGLRESLGTGTDISITGGSGPAYAGYSLVIKKIYDDAWRRPSDASDNSTVLVEVTISRDGRVLSSKIISKSSNSALVKSVKEALDRVRNVPPFPAGATDTERTFRINYNLKSKTDIG